MNSRWAGRIRSARWIVGLGVLGFVMAGLTSDATASPNARKLDRQISVLERVFDEMLIDSPNFLVRGRDNARGAYIEDHGLVLTFDTSLVNRGWNYDDDGHWWGRWWRHDDDDRVIIIDKDDDWDDDEEDDDKDKSSRGSYYERELKRQERRYERGKTEIVETIMDFADVLGEVPSEEWLEVRVRLQGARYFYENDLRRLNMRVKMSDVRSYSDGSMSEEAFVKAIQTQEK